MDENNNMIIITGALTLLGTLLGGMMSIIIDIVRRRWLVSDRHYDRKKEVLDRRCDQAEQYVQAATKDFRDIMLLSKTHYLEPETDIAIEQDNRRKAELYQIDNSIFSLGPSLRALDDEELLSQWNLMMVAFDAMKLEYQKAFRFRFFGDNKIEPKAALSNIEELWLEYSKALGIFYNRLDKIRNRL